jgi:hypothetical protein
MERRRITLLNSTHQLSALAAAAMAARLLSLQLFSLSFYSLHTLTFFLSHLLSHNMPLYRHFLATFSSNSKGTMGPEIMPLIVALVMLPLSHN